MNDNKDFLQFTTKSNEKNYNYNNQDILKFSDSGYDFEYLQRAQGIEICLSKLKYNDHKNVIKDFATASNCISKLVGSHKLFLENASFE